MYCFQISWKKALQRNKILGHFLLGLRQDRLRGKNAFITCRILSFCLLQYTVFCLTILPGIPLILKTAAFSFLSFGWKCRGVVPFRLCEKNNLSDDSVEVGVGWSLHPQVPCAQLVDCLYDNLHIIESNSPILYTNSQLMPVYSVPHPTSSWRL